MGDIKKDVPTKPVKLSQIEDAYKESHDHYVDALNAYNDLCNTKIRLLESLSELDDTMRNHKVLLTEASREFVIARDAKSARYCELEQKLIDEMGEEEFEREIERTTAAITGKVAPIDKVKDTVDKLNETVDRVFAKVKAGSK